MSTVDITEMLAGLTGEDYISAIRGIQADARARGGRLRCGGDGCTNPAVWIGMHGCGAPGTPVCQEHYEQQLAWIKFAGQQGQSYCRHCGDDVDASHIYVVPIGEQQ
jgi:hypothetical protein